MLGWLSRHKAPVVIILLVLYILFVHDSAPKLRGPSPDLTVSTSGPTTNWSAGTGHPTTIPVTAQSAGDVQLFAPDAEDADPHWNLPAELSTAELTQMVKDVQSLGDNFGSLQYEWQQYEEAMSALLDQNIVNMYWSRLNHGGFKDANLPLDWYQVVKGREGTINQFAELTEMMASMPVISAISLRLQSVQVRLIGGKVLIGDVLFVKSFTPWVQNRRAYFQQMNQLAHGVEKRQESEFRLPQHNQ